MGKNYYIVYSPLRIQILYVVQTLLVAYIYGVQVSPSYARITYSTLFLSNTQVSRL